MNALLQRIIQLNKAFLLAFAAFLGILFLLAIVLVGAGTILDVFGVYDPVLTLGLLGIGGLIAVAVFFYYSFNHL